ncbi:hypothetical protein ACQUJT_20175 [Ralstonia pseudosolanacearum]
MMNDNAADIRAELWAEWRKVLDDYLNVEQAWLDKVTAEELPSHQDVQTYKECVDRFTAEAMRLREAINKLRG